MWQSVIFLNHLHDFECYWPTEQVQLLKKLQIMKNIAATPETSVENTQKAKYTSTIVTQLNLISYSTDTGSAIFLFLLYSQ